MVGNFKDATGNSNERALQVKLKAGAEFSRSLSVFLSDIKISHSIFALPFACSTLLLMPEVNLDFLVVWKLLVCMVSARTFAMGMNRIVDFEIDAKNPRTLGRSIPSGKITLMHASVWTLAAGAIFIGSSFSINQLTGFCSILVLAIFALYPLWKKWSWLTHWYLGICLGLSPMAVSVAIAGKIVISSAILGLAVAMWTAGFDIIYALLDREFDQQNSIKSVPAQFGNMKALHLSRACFGVSVLCWVAIGSIESLGFIYFCGVAVICIILIIEHFWVREAASGIVPKRLNAAFFNLNAFVSLIYFLFLAADKLDRGWT